MRTGTIGVIVGLLVVVAGQSASATQTLVAVQHGEADRATQPKRMTISTLDLSSESSRQVVVDEDPKRYFGHR